jgi:hypothetical protein
MSGTVATLLDRCQAAGLSLMVGGDALHVDYERCPPADLIEELRRYKAEIMAALSAPAEKTGEDRAAALIAAAPSREWTAGLARLRPDRPPRDVPAGRWQQFISDARRLVDDGWAEKAAEFGWAASELFGCDERRPFTRIDRMGLAWFIKGGRVIAMPIRAAVIELPVGVRQTYRRKPSASGGVPAWDVAP